MGSQRCQRAIECAKCGGDERFFCEVARIRNEIARGKIIGSVGDDVVIPDQGHCILGRQSDTIRFDLHVRVQAPHCRCGTLDLGMADVVGCENHLSLQVRQ